MSAVKLTDKERTRIKDFIEQNLISRDETKRRLAVRLDRAAKQYDISCANLKSAEQLAANATIDYLETCAQFFEHDTRHK
jgi:hypothetical protein